MNPLVGRVGISSGRESISDGGGDGEVGFSLLEVETEDDMTS